MLRKHQLSVVEVAAATVITVEVAPKSDQKKKQFGSNRVDLKGSSRRKRNLFATD